MDLKNNEITVGEIVANPAAKAILKKEFPEVMNPVLLAMGRGFSLGRVLSMAGERYPQAKIEGVLEKLRAL